MNYANQPKFGVPVINATQDYIDPLLNGLPQINQLRNKQRYDHLIQLMDNQNQQVIIGSIIQKIQQFKYNVREKQKYVQNLERQNQHYGSDYQKYYMQQQANNGNTKKNAKLKNQWLDEDPLGDFAERINTKEQNIFKHSRQPPIKYNNSMTDPLQQQYQDQFLGINPVNINQQRRPSNSRLNILQAQLEKQNEMISKLLESKKNDVFREEQIGRGRKDELEREIERLKDQVYQIEARQSPLRQNQLPQYLVDPYPMYPKPPLNPHYMHPQSYGQQIMGMPYYQQVPPHAQNPYYVPNPYQQQPYAYQNQSYQNYSYQDPYHNNTQNSVDEILKQMLADGRIELKKPTKNQRRNTVEEQDSLDASSQDQLSSYQISPPKTVPPPQKTQYKKPDIPLNITQPIKKFPEPKLSIEEQKRARTKLQGCLKVVRCTIKIKQTLQRKVDLEKKQFQLVNKQLASSNESLKDQYKKEIQKNFLELVRLQDWKQNFLYVDDPKITKSNSDSLSILAMTISKYYIDAMIKSHKALSQELLGYVALFSIPGTLVKEEYHCEFVTRRLRANIFGRFDHESSHDQSLMVMAEFFFLRIGIENLFNINVWFKDIMKVPDLLPKLKLIISILHIFFFDYFRNKIEVQNTQFKPMNLITKLDFEQKTWEKLVQTSDASSVSTLTLFYLGLFSEETLFQKINTQGGFMNLFKITQNVFQKWLEQLSVKIQFFQEIHEEHKQIKLTDFVSDLRKVWDSKELTDWASKKKSLH